MIRVGDSSSCKGSSNVYANLFRQVPGQSFVANCFKKWRHKVTKENTSRATRVLGTVLKYAAFGGAIVLAILVAAHFAWMYSGSNQWELAIDQNGIKIYTLKARGQLVKRLKGVTQVKTTLTA